MTLMNRLLERRAKSQGGAVEDAQPANAVSKPGVGTSWPIVWPSLCFFLGAVTLLLIIARSVGTMSADLSGNGDSSAHFVNGLLVRDYLLSGFGHNPLVFSTEYYRNFPRVTIGHWPPGFYLVEGVLQVVFGRGVVFARILQIVILATMGGLVMAQVAARAGTIVGIAAGIAVVLSPELLRLANFVMTDTFLALLTFLAAMSWARYAVTRATAWAVCFGVVSILAILTKASGLGLGLLPPLFCALTGQWRILLLTRTWLAALIVAVPAGAWYVLTYSITADGFVYSFGWNYTSVALGFFPQALLGQVGLLPLLAFVLGVIDLMRRHRRNAIDPLDASLAAMAIAMFGFLLVAPADLQTRYLIPIIPPVLVVGILTMHRAVCWLMPLRSPPVASVVATACLVLFSLVTVAQPPHVVSMQMDRVAEAILADAPAGAVVLAATAARTEGGLIAAFASAGDRRIYVVRGTKFLASSTLMGANYATRFASARAVSAAITASPIDWVVIAEETQPDRLEHTGQVAAALAISGGDWRLHSQYRGDISQVRVFRRSHAAVTDNDRAAFLKALAPTKFVR